MQTLEGLLANGEDHIVLGYGEESRKRPVKDEERFGPWNLGSWDVEPLGSWRGSFSWVDGLTALSRSFTAHYSCAVGAVYNN